MAIVFGYEEKEDKEGLIQFQLEYLINIPSQIRFGIWINSIHNQILHHPEELIPCEGEGGLRQGDYLPFSSS